MPTEIKLNRITDDDIGSVEFVIDRVKQIEALLEQLHLKDKIKYTQAQLEAIDVVVTYINGVSNILKQHRDEIQERLKTDSLEPHNGHAKAAK